MHFSNVWYNTVKHHLNDQKWANKTPSTHFTISVLLVWADAGLQVNSSSHRLTPPSHLLSCWFYCLWGCQRSQPHVLPDCNPANGSFPRAGPARSERKETQRLKTCMFIWRFRVKTSTGSFCCTCTLFELHHEPGSKSSMQDKFV